MAFLAPLLVPLLEAGGAEIAGGMAGRAVAGGLMKQGVSEATAGIASRATSFGASQGIRHAASEVTARQQQRSAELKSPSP